MTSARLPATVRPMLATLGPMPHGPDWAFEFKWDGVRAVISTAGDKVQAISRNDIDITVSYPELAGLPGQTGGRRLVLDGELITLDARGASSFSLLQQRMHTKDPAQSLVAKIPVLFYAFDLLWLDDTSTVDRSYNQRREALESLSLQGTTPMSIPPSFDGPGQALLEAAAEHGIEGVVAKRRASPYLPGRRSPAWTKNPDQPDPRGHHHRLATRLRTPRRNHRVPAAGRQRAEWTGLHRQRWHRVHPQNA